MANELDKQTRQQAQAAALIEALPYIQQFRGKTVVIKYGGAAMEDPVLVESTLRDVVFLEVVGVNPVIVHGGGKAITRALKKNGVQAQFVNGLRVSDADSMRVIERTLSREINPSIVERLESLGGKARGFPGSEIFRAEKLVQTDPNTNEPIDLGFVGFARDVDVWPLQAAIRDELVPVISPTGRDADGAIYNINADMAASAAARALQAHKIVFLSDVNGIRSDPSDPESTIPTLRTGEIDALKADGTISGGMIPKVESARETLAAGVSKVHFLDGRIPHALLLELFTDAGIGTEIIEG